MWHKHLTFKGLIVGCRFCGDGKAGVAQPLKLSGIFSTEKKREFQCTFVHSIVTEYLPYVRLCSRLWRYGNE